MELETCCCCCRGRWRMRGLHDGAAFVVGSRISFTHQWCTYAIGTRSGKSLHVAWQFWYGPIREAALTRHRRSLRNRRCVNMFDLLPPISNEFGKSYILVVELYI
ncbi:hypothetical protein PHMEG_0003473 [Phytophthora megakarya]|uniref:Uncharacterized protein n=1 Tax=Phytophthora megakarya TaxID=4795 RepID=A0A225WW98_9STRA|nr:hypothetical protein PHMEG_0003473 [Phytophthora megakarya]